MRAKEWKRLAAQVIEPFGPALTMTGSLVHAPDTVTMLRGLAKDSSGFSTEFAIWAFVQPLGVPVDHLVFSYGLRLRHRQTDQEWWSSDPAGRASVIMDLQDAVTTQALPLLQRIGSAQGLLDHIEGTKHWTTDPHHIEAASCCVIELDDRQRADGLRACLRRSTWAPGWPKDAAERASRRLEEFMEDPDGARQRLLQTSVATAEGLGLRGSQQHT